MASRLQRKDLMRRIGVHRAQFDRFPDFALLRRTTSGCYGANLALGWP